MGGGKALADEEDGGDEERETDEAGGADGPGVADARDQFIDEDRPGYTAEGGASDNGAEGETAALVEPVRDRGDGGVEPWRVYISYCGDLYWEVRVHTAWHHRSRT